MILILSDLTDRSTNSVIDWLRFWEIPFIRLNETSIIQEFDLFLSGTGVDAHITVKDFRGIQSFYFSEISAYWYRRGALVYPKPSIEHENEEISTAYNRYVQTENDNCIHFLHKLLKEKPGIGSFLDNTLNKLEVLNKARQCGLDIPNTLVTNQHKSLNRYQKERGKIIQKAIGPMGYVPLPERHGVGFYTREISAKEIDGNQEEFSPSLFQEMLDKKYELRIFYLFGECYITAIFSQQDEKTKLDFRLYNAKKPNRTPQYKLPEKVRAKIQRLMEKLDMQSGSIDIVVTQDDRFVFLEVNPVGQYAQVAYPINIDLNKKIAERLKEMYERGNKTTATGTFG